MNIKLANRLIELRKSRGYSQESLADELGISRQAISKWERAESSPDTDNLISLAKLYGITLDELLKTDDDFNTFVSKETERKENQILRIINMSMPLLCLIVYLVIGFFFSLWHPGWIIFLFIPIWTSLINAINHKNLSEFSYPVLAVFLYILFSSIFGLWHPLWVIFLTIPIYYAICNHIKFK